MERNSKSTVYILERIIFCLQETIAKSQEAQYNEVASVLRNVLPSAAPSTPIGHEWLQTFADNLKHELEKRDMEKKQLETQVQEKTVVKHVEKAESALDSRVKELSAQNEHLQGLVDKYKTIIDDTVSVANSNLLIYKTELVFVHIWRNYRRKINM